MKKLIYYSLSLLLLGALGCKKDQYYLYNDVGRLQFGPEPSRLYTDSYRLADTVKPFTFFYEGADVTQDTVFFDIYTVGKVSKNDRTFKLMQIQVDGVNNAVANKQYVGFDNDLVTNQYVIKAGEIHARVPVILLREASLKDTSCVLKFQVVANDNFKLGQEENLWREVIFTDRLSQPAAWDNSFTKYYLGNYSRTKHKFMIDSTGQKWDQDFILTLRTDYALLQYWTGECKKALIRYNVNHPNDLLRDENGELVVFP